MHFRSLAQRQPIRYGELGRGLLGQLKRRIANWLTARYPAGRFSALKGVTLFERFGNVRFSKTSDIREVIYPTVSLDKRCYCDGIAGMRTSICIRHWRLEWLGKKIGRTP